MSDKTCGTCGHAVNVLQPTENCLKKCYPTCVHHLDCPDWTERTDSVERIALDMLALIKAARMHPIVLDPNKMPGGQILVPLPETEFADRLRVLGIEVPE